MTKKQIGWRLMVAAFALCCLPFAALAHFQSLDAVVLNDHNMSSLGDSPISIQDDIEFHDDFEVASHRSMSDSSYNSPFSNPPSSSATSYSSDAEMRSLSPAPSVYSMTSSLREQSYRIEFSRGLNNHSEVYRLPADPEELDRLSTFSILITIRAQSYTQPR